MPTLLEARATGDRDDPRLPSDAQVGEMFVFFPQVSTGFEPNDVLEPGEAIEFEVGYHGESAGTTDITAHLHASFSFADLFPRTNGTHRGEVGDHHEAVSRGDGAASARTRAAVRSSGRGFGRCPRWPAPPG